MVAAINLDAQVAGEAGSVRGASMQASRPRASRSAPMASGATPGIQLDLVAHSCRSGASHDGRSHPQDQRSPSGEGGGRSPWPASTAARIGWLVRSVVGEDPGNHRAIDGDAEAPSLLNSMLSSRSPGVHREAGLFVDGDFGKPGA